MAIIKARLFAEQQRDRKPDSLEQMGGKTLRLIGLARAKLHLNRKAATYNLRRLCSLMQVVQVGPAPVWRPKWAWSGRKRPDPGTARRKHHPTNLKTVCELVGSRCRHGKFRSEERQFEAPAAR